MNSSYVLYIYDPGSIPGSAWFSEKYRIWNGVHSSSWVQLRSYFKETVAAQVYKTEIMAVGDPPCWLRDTLLSALDGAKYKRLKLGGGSVYDRSSV
jgi:hypothetical protein